MKSSSELTDFYYQSLYPTLTQLEKDRLSILSSLKWYGGMGLVTLIFLLIWGVKHFSLLHPFTFVVIGVFIALALGVYRTMTQGYVRDFKLRILTPLIKAMDEKLLYNPESMVSQYLFEHSKLFPHAIDRYRGNDYVKGSIDNVALEFSDVHAEYQTRDSKGRTQWHTLFRGLFLIAEFNKHFKSRTVILPDLAQKQFGSLLGGWLQSMNRSRDELIRLDNPEFEKKFVVYGNDAIEARYILTHSMMQQILDFQRKLTAPLSISFVHNHIHIAIDTRKDLFEPAILTSLLDYKQTMEYINTLRYTIGIIDELKLNEKLWSKE